MTTVRQIRKPLAQAADALKSMCDRPTHQRGAEWVEKLSLALAELIVGLQRIL